MVELDWNGDLFKYLARKGAVKALNRSLNVVDADAKLKTPVRTGNLRGSYDKQVFPDKLLGIEFNTAEYAPNVELGTKHQSAQPSLRPALFGNQDKIKQIFVQEERKAFDN